MSLDRIFKALVDLGLSQTEAKVYIFLVMKGPNKAGKVAAALEIRRQQIYRILKRLQNKSIIVVHNEQPAKFSALPFDEALNLLVQLKKKNAKNAQNSKKELLSNWQTLMKKNPA